MHRNLDQLDPAEAWAPWTPTADDPWSLAWAGHLYRRAGFGATWAELQTALQDGPEETITQLLSGGDGHAEFNELMDALAPESQSSQAVDALQNWWLHRMLLSPHPFLERMTLFWHDHFATSIVKVRQPALMSQQNMLLRRHALGTFPAFLLDMSRDAAMLIWLDSNSNVKGKPNENYARELFELFCLGVGNYTEQDIREAARAFTGWGVDGSRYVFNGFQHDDGPKTVLGQSGPWDGEEVVRIALEQPAAARFLVRKLYRRFISESQSPPDALLAPLAEQFRESGYDIAALMETMLRSRQFFSRYAYRQRIKSPAELVVGMLRTLEARPDGAGTPLPLPALMNDLGQSLFSPPSVKGWDGGEAWLNSAAILGRHNAAWQVLQGLEGPLRMQFRPAVLIERNTQASDAATRVDFLLNLLLQPGPGELTAPARQKLTAYLASPRGVLREERLLETAHAVLCMPEYQLA